MPFMCIAIYYIKFENQNYPKIIFTLFLYLFVCEHTGNNLSLRRKFRLTFYYSDMPLTNNVMIVRHKLLTNLIKLWKDNQLVERIDRLPIELSPRTSRVLGRLLRTQGARRVEIQIFPADGFRHVRRNRRTHPAVRICPQSPGAQRAAAERQYSLRNRRSLLVVRADQLRDHQPLQRLRGPGLCHQLPEKRHRIQSCRQSGHQPRSLHQLRHLPQQLPLPCHRLYARTVRRGLPRKGDYQGRTRRGAYR